MSAESILNSCFYSHVSREELAPLIASQGYFLPKTQQGLFLGIRFQSEWIGYALFLESHPDKFDLVSIYVLPMFRSLGIGSELLNFAQGFFAEKKKTFLIKFSTKYDVKKVMNFYRKNGIDNIALDYTIYKISLNKWVNVFHAKLFDLRNVVLEETLKCKKTESLTEVDISQLNNCFKLNKLPAFLDPLKKHSVNQQEFSTYFFDDQENVVGWNLASINKRSELVIYCTYVIPQKRSSGLGMFSWHLLYATLKEKGKLNQIKSIVFSFDKKNERLYRFFFTVCQGQIEEEIDYYIIKS